MSDARRKRSYVPNELAVVLMDRDSFGRRLSVILLRAIGIHSIQAVDTPAKALCACTTGDISAVIIGGEVSPDGDPAVCTSLLRHHPNSDVRNLPVIGVCADHGAQNGRRDTHFLGMDAVLTRPLSPDLLGQCLRAAIESPRPLVEAGSYIGPCRRHEDMADIFGPGRRKNDPSGPNGALKEDAIGQAISALGCASGRLRPGSIRELPSFQRALAVAQRAATEQSDSSLCDSLDMYGAYVLRTLSRGTMEQTALETSMSALMQLTLMPSHMETARRTVANELVRVVTRKTAIAS